MAERRPVKVVLAREPQPRPEIGESWLQAVDCRPYITLSDSVLTRFS